MGSYPRRLHPVEVHPLMGGVLVDKQDLVPLLHDDVGVQHFPGQPPGEDPPVPGSGSASGSGGAGRGAPSPAPVRV